MRRGGRYELDPKTGNVVRVEGTEPLPAPWQRRRTESADNDAVPRRVRDERRKRRG